MLVLNVWNWTLLEGAGVPDVSLANVGALVSSCMMLARLGYWQFYHVWFNDYGRLEVQKFNYKRRCKNDTVLYDYMYTCVSFI